MVDKRYLLLVNKRIGIKKIIISSKKTIEKTPKGAAAPQHLR